MADRSSDGPRIFLTGVTGYVGGEVLHQLTQEPVLQQASITCLIRDSKKAQEIEEQYSQIKALVADLDATDAIQHAASNSDIVLHLASFRHPRSAQAIVQGLKDRALTKSNKKGYWIQISGASLFASDEIKHSRFGEHTNEVWNGLRDADKIRTHIRNNPGREVDNLALSSSGDNVHVALIIGPLIYGPGNGPGNRRSMQAPDMTKYILTKGHAFRLNAGLNRWSTIHVSDIAGLITKLVVSATSGGHDADKLWNEFGLYTPETGIADFTKLSKEILDKAHNQGLVQNSDTVVPIDAEEADKIMDHGSILLGTNAVLDQSQAQQVPGWNVQYPSLSQTLSALIKSETS